MSRQPFVAALAVLGLLAFVPGASATDYCVAPNTTCGGTNEPTLEAALDLADNNVAADRIFLGAATYTAPTSTGYLYNNFAGPVEIIGAGIGQTILTGQLGSSQSVLRVSSGTTASSIHDLTVRLPQSVQSGYVGLQSEADVQRVDVVEAPSQSQLRTGIRVEGSDLGDSTVTLGTNTGSSYAVVMYNGTETVRNVTGTGRWGLLTFGGTIDHARLLGTKTGIEVARGVVIATDTLITVTQDSGTGVYVGAQSGQNTTFTADGMTIIGPGSGTSAGIYASNSSSDTQSVTANIADTVLRGFTGPNLAAFGTTANVQIAPSYSDYDSSSNEHGGTGSITAMAVTNFGDARFVDPATGDFRLRHDSPLIDVGEPAPPSTTTDLAGGARLVDGDLLNGARRDIGAFEYQARSPSAAISGPDSALTGDALSFSAAGSSDPDPGDALTYSWTVDGVAAGTAVDQAAVFTEAGTHTVALVVTDPLGRQASAQKTVAVAARPGGGPSPAVADTVAPLISSLSARPTRVRRGRAMQFRFHLSETAAVKLKIQRALPGRRQGGACRAPSARNRTGRRCTRFVRLTTLSATGKQGANTVPFSGRVKRRKLATGRYRALVTAVDAAGNRSIARAVSFKVVPA
jgi:hypothetical protein